MPDTAAPPDIARVVAPGELELSLHPGQERAWESAKRFVLVLAGRQSGKTSFGPYWLWEEIQRRGPGDYLVVAPTFALLRKKCLPEFLKLFARRLKLGEFNKSEWTFYFSPKGDKRTHGAAPDEPTKVFFGHAANPESLESATAKAAWLDEAGQKTFRLGSWEAIQGRLSLHRGRCLLTTTPYDLGWLKTQLYDPWEESGRDHPDADVVNFDSTENPAFSREEFERLSSVMSREKFDMFYRGKFSRPAGLIYDRFDPKRHTCPPFRIADTWPRYVGVDFGPTNTAAVFLAAELDPASRVPTGRYFAYREYHPGKMEPATHAKNLTTGEPRLPTFVGGAPSEDEWRARFRAAGVPVMPPPVKDVEVGIDAVYEMTAQGRLIVCDDLKHLLDQLASYSRVVDEQGEPTGEIDEPRIYHYLDALRYVCVWLKRCGPSAPSAPAGETKGVVESAPAGVFATDAPPERGRAEDRGGASVGGMIESGMFPKW